MNLDQSFVTILVSFITGGAVWFLVRPNSQKLTGDAYSSLTNSINLLSRRVDELEREKAKIFDELDNAKRKQQETEDKLIIANQRISALEDDLDKRDKAIADRDRRILELESSSVKRSGFGGR